MSRPTITVVHTPACHLCADAEEVLAELGREIPLTVEPVAAGSAAGAALVARHRPGMFPLVLVDGALFSTGRLPRRKLRALLATRAAAGSRR